MTIFKDPRVKQAEEMLDVLEENNTNKLIGGLTGAFITILIGATILNQIKKQL